MPFYLNLKGQVNEINLPKSKALWPLFETIVNSIQSIEDSANKENGKIYILGKRREDNQLSINEDDLTEFTDFVIKDNGTGFDRKNYESFMEAYSDYKVVKGCKGIGRFLWLKAFENVHIDSVFCEDNKWLHRIFDFNIVNGIENESIEEAVSNEYSTSVTLSNIFQNYINYIPLNIEKIAIKIIEHCLIYFLGDNCPKMIFADDKGNSIDLNDYYNKNIKDRLHQDHITINNNEFVIYHICMQEGTDKHELHLCANNREVKSYDLSKHIKNLQKRLVTDDGDTYFYVGYLIGKYLDESVNTNRTAFEFEEEETFLDDITPDKLFETACEQIKVYLGDDLEKIKREKKEQIDKFIRYKKPQYRYVLNNRPEIYDDIPFGLNEDKLELELHKQTQKWESDIHKKGKELEKKVNDSVYDTDEYMELFREYNNSLYEISKVSLAEYVVRRKAILAILEKALEINEDDEYKKEAKIHSIICPMRITSDDVDFEEMNLWLIDDRLAYHHFLASDMQLKSLPTIDSKSLKRMDIAVFDRALSFSSDSENINSISIIELKRPQRNDLDADDKNPINQVIEYVDEIKSGKKLKANGRGFGDVDNVAFYCYIIADLTPTMKKAARNASLNETPDKMGYFGYNNSVGAYIEVISYDKLIKDAKQRNQVLFDKLFSPKINQIILKNEDTEQH